MKFNVLKAIFAQHKILTLYMIGSCYTWQ